MMGSVLVTGATGLLGSAVVKALTNRRIAFAASGRGPVPQGFTGEWCQADLLSGNGLEAALAGRSCIIHCATSPPKPEHDIVVIDLLIDEVRRRGQHLVHIGITGIEDAAPKYAYYQAKLECERRLSESDIPHTIMRAAIFHPYVDSILRKMTLGPFLIAPRMTLQPVSISYVADELVTLSIERSIGRVQDVVGPEALDLRRLTDIWFRGAAGPKLRVPIPAIGPLIGLTALRVVQGMVGGETWAQWVAAQSA